MFQDIQTALVEILDLGGPVVAVLLVVSILTLALILYKLWQFHAAGVGRHRALGKAVAAWDDGARERASRHLGESTSYLAPVIGQAMNRAERSDGLVSQRLDAEAEARFARLEAGFKLLDMVAQLAPLLGLFGTVLGMIEAFRTLQGAGSTVDPSLLAGGIWVALLTTAAGLAVAMPAALVLSWFEGRMHRERVFAERSLRTILAPGTPGRDVQAHAA
ncbi:MotA/TolQ/ExbB proton channel family protein [Marivita sp. GX14005]|uniref:MotA/TolQ/ExbB proton channel family protein n=1 Tax=Marivita sp. GX14005 TaxID=2942276 RepID=UPI0020188FDB|nr:MotA/TolQ/ExbB proton channel family protein [Marivita sp. GX14005]MCL3883375.1 MotA/TolQ/ExbB proton channel family protein [Marivita sp. GX14005]